MKRKEFFKRIGLGFLIAPVAGKVIADSLSRLPIKPFPSDLHISKSGMSIEEMMRIYDETGMMVMDTGSGHFIDPCELRVVDYKHSQITGVSYDKKGGLGRVYIEAAKKK